MISLFGGLYILVLIIVIESSCFFTINFPLTDAMRRQEPNLEENTIYQNGLQGSRDREGGRFRRQQARQQILLQTEDF